jgi:hypothetical protein
MVMIMALSSVVLYLAFEDLNFSITAPVAANSLVLMKDSSSSYELKSFDPSSKSMMGISTSSNSLSF